MTIQEFKDGGYLQELNRKFLHRLGLALSIKEHDDGSIEFGEIIDSRVNKEGIIFDDTISQSKQYFDNICKIDRELAEKDKSRFNSLGFCIQP